LLLLLVAVVLLTLQALAINRLAGIPYPLWNPVKEPGESSGKSG
jgi:CBS domain-containing membrane protein